MADIQPTQSSKTDPHAYNLKQQKQVATPAYPFTQQQSDDLFNYVWAPLKEFKFSDGNIPTASELQNALPEMQKYVGNLMAGLSPSDPYYTTVQNVQGSLNALSTDLKQGNVANALSEVNKMTGDSSQNLADIMMAIPDGKVHIQLKTSWLETIDSEIAENHLDHAVSNLQGYITYLQNSGQQVPSDLQTALATLQQSNPTPAALLQARDAVQIHIVQLLAKG